MTRLRPLALLAACALLPLTAGCFSLSDEPNCAFQCGDFNANHCPDDYSCASDGYCHKTGFTGICPYPQADMVVAPKPDMSGADMTGTLPDMTVLPDMTILADMTGVLPDLTVLPDLSILDDLTVLPDLTTLPDMSTLADLSSLPDLTALPDLTSLPDMVCLPANCTTPPANTCTGATRNVYPNPGTCDVNGGCVYTAAPMACTDGCFGGACTAPFSGVGTTTATQGGAIALVTVVADGTSAGGGPANHTAAVTITTKTSPGGTTSGVNLVWSLDPTFAAGVTTTPMTLTTPAMASDTWSATIPTQAMGVEVYLFVSATPYNGAVTTDPAAAMSHYAYAVQ